MSVKFNDKEVTNPVLKVLVAIMAGTGALFAAAGLMLFIGLALVTFPVWLPLDRILKWRGKRGFVVAAEDGYHFSLEFTPGAFRGIE